jgi:hypothetical protein
VQKSTAGAMDESWRSVGKDRDFLKGQDGERKSQSAETEEEGTDKSYYAFLNLSPSCSQDEIKAAYKRLALIWHPDRHNDEVSRAHATTKFARLTHIYEVLTNPAKRQVNYLCFSAFFHSPKYNVRTTCHSHPSQQIRAGSDDLCSNV